MAGKTLDELIGQIFSLHNQILADETSKKRLLDRKNLLGRKIRVTPELKKKADDLDQNIIAQNNEIKKLLKDWCKEQVDQAIEQMPLHPAQPIVYEAKVEINLDVVKDAFPVGKRVRFGHVNVPVGQIYVFGHEAMDESGFPEVYLGGETILTKWKDKKSLVAALAEAPGEIRCIFNQWLAGISVSTENVAKVSIQIPVFLHNPVQILKRSGGAWMFTDGRENINHDLREQMEHQLQEILGDRVQFWSGETHEVLDRICIAVNRNLAEWGLQVKPESVSIIRQLPKTIYEIVSQFSKAEQAILDSIAADKKDLLLEESGLTLDDLTFIEASAERENGGRGEGLFLVLRNNTYNFEEKSEIQNKIFNWLRVHAGALVANYFNDIVKLYVQITKSDYEPNQEPGLSDIRLSEQVVLSAIRNPMIGLGEVLETIR